MPINSLNDTALNNKAEFSIGRDVELSFCSGACLLRNLNDRSRIVRTGQTPATALTVIMDDDKLLVPITTAPRPETHILGAQHGHQSARANWEKLVGCTHSSLMPVYRVCNCMAETQILDAQEFEDAATTPAWKKVRGIVGKARVPEATTRPIAFGQWCVWMANLAEGLDALEKLGLAHGDPYPFNAVHRGIHATWVDFGHMTDDPEQRFKDAWAFVLFTVIHTQRLTSTHSLALEKNLATALTSAEQAGRFSRLKSVFEQSYSDLEPFGDLRQPSLILARAYADQTSRSGNPALAELLVKASAQYFSDMLHHIQRGNQYLKALHIEQQRYLFMEKETVRLTVPKAEHAREMQSLSHVIERRDVTISQLNESAVKSEHELHSFKLAAADTQENTDKLNELLAQRDEQIAHLNRVIEGRLNELLAQRDEQIAHLNRVIEDHAHHAHHAIEQRNATVSELNESAVKREQELHLFKLAAADTLENMGKLNVLLAQRDEQIAHLNRVVEDHAQHVNHLADVSRSYYAQLTQVLVSRSWKITRPMRAAARFIKWGGMTDTERGKLYNFAKRAYHRIPVSYETKLVFRKYFLSFTGWTPATPAAANRAAAVAAVTSRQVVSANPDSVTSGTSTYAAAPGADLGLLSNAQSNGNRVPYFGVRRPEGQRRVAILTNQLLDWNDGRPRFGGGERYALELARLLKELSFEVTFYQPSFKAPGEGEYYGFKVVLLRTADSIGEFHYGLCNEFTALTRDFDHVYYHLPEYASGNVREDGLMTCHGIWFDHNNYPGAIFRTPEWFQQLYAAFSSPRCVVSVDTNSIGVIRSLWPELSSNMRFIPNFYDMRSYHPKPESRNPDRLTILFPRRSQINRGSRIFGEIVSLIPYDVEIIWLGEGDPVDTQIVKDVCKNDKRASFAVADFDQMPQWYQKADIAVIPTIACEGTSLSCIEALAVGCAVVSTNVGGLPDLVYDGMNGLLVDPDARSLAAAINRLIVDRELRERLQQSAVDTAHHFELKSWRKRWADVLNEYGWVTDKALNSWKGQQGDRALAYETPHSEKWLILTRNAIHGGVESLIREEAKGLNAPVIVCGGHDRKDTCPFEYTRADDPKALTKVIAGYDVILYHWLPDWCLDVLKRSGKRCIEFVHRTDTADSDKSVPTALVTHSAFLARYIHEATARSCRVVDHPIAIDRFKPQAQKGQFVGAITSYYDTKGIDVFLQAWALMKNHFPRHGARFYGAGDDLPKFRKLAAELGLDVDFRDATTAPWESMKDFACFVVPSRIEGLPVAILEALAMNIPVVASDLPGMVEFNELSKARGYSSFVHLSKKEDPQDLAEVISRVLSQDSNADSGVYIRDYYSPEKHCSDLVSIYRELCH